LKVGPSINQEFVASFSSFSCEKLTIDRNQQTQKFACPCGAVAHQRRNPEKLQSLCRKNPHSEPDEHHFADSDDEEDLDIDNQASSHDSEDPLLEDEHSPLDGDRPPLDDGDAPFDDVDQDHDFDHPWEPTPPAAEPDMFVETETTVDSDVIHQEENLVGQSGDSQVDMVVDLDPDHTTYLEETFDSQSDDEAADPVDIQMDSCSDNDMDVNLEGGESDYDIPGLDRIRSTLRDFGIEVHPQYNWIICIDCGENPTIGSAHSHRRNKHKLPRNSPKKLPTPSTFHALLRELHADHPLPAPTHAIERIPNLKCVDAVRCGVEDCPIILANRKRLSEHCFEHHPTVLRNRRPFISVTAHQLGDSFRRNRKYVQIINDVDRRDDSIISDILQKFVELKVGKPPSTYTLANNARSLTPFLAKTGWHKPLQGVNIPRLQATVLPPNPECEPNFHHLKDIVRQYYMSAGKLIDQLSTLTLRYIRSANPG
jgi:hypothetical protein